MNQGVRRGARRFGVIVGSYLIGFFSVALLMLLLPTERSRPQADNAATTAIESSQAATERPSAVERRPTGKIHLVDLALPAATTASPSTPSTPKNAPSPTVDTRETPIEQQGMVLLENAQALQQLSITFELPDNLPHRDRVAGVLRQCMGVRLGKVDSRGRIVAREPSASVFSPYVRMVQGKLATPERRVLNQWRGLPGQAVRFYPRQVDARLLGGLWQLLDRKERTKNRIQGEFILQEQQLNLINIRINGRLVNTTLTLGTTCIKNSPNPFDNA